MLKPPLYLHRDPAFGSGDSILIEVLDSGLVKITTDQISGPNHSSAEGLVKTVRTMLGGETHIVKRRVYRAKNKLHVHSHQNE